MPAIIPVILSVLKWAGIAYTGYTVMSTTETVVDNTPDSEGIIDNVGSKIIIPIVVGVVVFALTKVIK